MFLVLIALMCALPGLVPSVCAAGLPASPLAAPPSEHVGAMPSLGAKDWVTLAILVGAPVLLVVLWFADIIRPGSLARAGLRKLEPFPWWIWLAMAMLIFLAGQFVGAIVHASLGVPSWIDPPMQAQVAVNGSVAIAGIAAGVALLRMILPSAPGAGVRPRWSDLAVGLWCFVLTYPIVLAASSASAAIWSILHARAPDSLAHETLKQLARSDDPLWAWIFRATLVLLVPVFEELIYRVGLQSAMLRLTGRPWAAILVTSAVFTSAHIPVMPGHALSTIAVLSVGIGLAYERTKRLGVPLVMHALFNTVNVLTAIWMVPASSLT